MAEITARTRFTVAFILVCVLIMGAANLLASWQITQASNHKWCATLITLDNADQKAEKAPPADRPKGAYSMQLIQDFHQLRDEFCG